jgi:hypothetical protein
MSTNFQIKAPDGRIVQAPQNVIVTRTDKDGSVTTLIDPDKLKPGWSVATPACLAKKQAENAAAEKARADRAEAEKPAVALGAAIAAATAAKKGG